jgi:hypothetical protein
MHQARFGVPSCIERERLEFELLEVRARGQYRARLRSLTREEQAASEQLVDHGLEHGCSG